LRWPNHAADFEGLERVGVTLELQQGDIAVWRTQIIGEHKMPHSISLGGKPDRIDPDFFLTILSSAQTAPGGSNYGHPRSRL
jgi:hypothetical protein